MKRACTTSHKCQRVTTLCLLARGAVSSTNSRAGVVQLRSVTDTQSHSSRATDLVDRAVMLTPARSLTCSARSVPWGLYLPILYRNRSICRTKQKLVWILTHVDEHSTFRLYRCISFSTCRDVEWTNAVWEKRAEFAGMRIRLLDDHLCKRSYDYNPISLQPFWI